MKEKVKEDKQNNKIEPEEKTTIVAQNGTDRTRTKKTVVVKSVKQGAGIISSSGDFIGRLGTLLVMVVTSINTGTSMVTSFIEGVYWKGGVHAFLLVFIHLPVIGVMIWLMCKARVQSMYRKIRPSKTGQTIDVTDVENETVVYEETIEVPENQVEMTDEKMTDGQKKIKTVKDRKNAAEKIKKHVTEEKVKGSVNTAEHINKAFDMPGSL